MPSIGELSKQLSGVEWAWTVEQIGTQVEQLGWKFVKDVRTRKEYRIDADLRASMYVHQEMVERIEITFDLFMDPESLDESEFEAMDANYRAKFQEAVQDVARKLGNPTFCDQWGAVGFPEDEEAVVLALWTSSTARLMVQYKHEDRELPLRICLVLASPQS